MGCKWSYDRARFAERFRSHLRLIEPFLWERGIPPVAGGSRLADVRIRASDSRKYSTDSRTTTESKGAHDVSVRHPLRLLRANCPYSWKENRSRATTRSLCQAQCLWANMQFIHKMSAVSRSLSESRRASLVCLQRKNASCESRYLPALEHSLRHRCCQDRCRCGRRPLHARCRCSPSLGEAELLQELFEAHIRYLRPPPFQRRLPRPCSGTRDWDRARLVSPAPAALDSAARAPGVDELA